MNKSERVRIHLIEKGSITSWEAIQLYRATRLSGIIYNLRERGMNIETVMMREKTSDGYSMPYAKYILKESKNESINN